MRSEIGLERFQAHPKWEIPVRKPLTKTSSKEAAMTGPVLLDKACGLSAPTPRISRECLSHHLPFAFCATVTFFLAGLGVATSRADDFGTRMGTQWAPYVEWTIENPTWSGNAFDVKAQVTFTHQASGEIRRTEMFYIGGESWAFRFTGTKTGVWSFVTTSEDEDLRGHVGKVTITKAGRPDAHGFLKKFGNKWGWEGTETAFAPQLVMWDYVAGSNSPRVFCGNPDLVARKVKEFVTDQGFHGFHVPVVGGRWFDVDSKSDKVVSSMTEPDFQTFEALELLITSTHQAGGFVHIWSWGDHQRFQTPRSLEGGINGAIDRRLQRYIAARLGPIPGWSMGYGFDLDEWVKARQLRQWRDAMHEWMGWHHFLGGRPAGPNRGEDHAADIVWNKGLDYSSYEHHRPTYEVYVAALQAIPGQPVMSEDRFRIRNNSRYKDKDYDEELTRHGFYHSTMAGGVANIWGVHPDRSPGGRYSNQDQLKTCSVFFDVHGRFLADMTPANQMSREDGTRVLLSRATQSLVVYRENDESIQIDLSRMPKPLHAVAVDTKRAYAEVDLGALKSKDQVIELPRVSDWVIAIGDFQPTSGSSQRVSKGVPHISFTDVWKGPGLKGGHGAMWADVDGDDLPDLYLPLIISDTLPDLFMHNRGDGKFSEEGEMRGIADRDGGSHGAAWCDLDNDGDYDLINGTTFDDGSGIQNDVFRNDGSGNFTEVALAAAGIRLGTRRSPPQRGARSRRHHGSGVAPPSCRRLSLRLPSGSLCQELGTRSENLPPYERGRDAELVRGRGANARPSSCRSPGVSARPEVDEGVFQTSDE